MRRICVLVVIAIIGILGSCATVNATGTIIDLGTIEYSNTHEKTLDAKIDSSEFVDLQYISSDIDSSSLYIFDSWFSPPETTYIFVAAQIEVDWWFINDIKGFIYQDKNTDQLYRVNVDYSAIEVPPDPLIEWIANYSILAGSFDELQELFNTTFKDFNETKKELEGTWQLYNQSKEEVNNTSIAMEAFEIELKDLNAKYNETKALWISASTNLSFYKEWYETLENEHGNLQKDYDNLNGIYPIYIFFAIIVTAVFMWIISKRKTAQERGRRSAIETDIDTGYTPKASKIDKFTAGITEKLTPKQRQKKKDITPETNNYSQDIHKKIDEVKLVHDTFQRSIVEDVRGIRNRVDIIESKIKKILHRRDKSAVKK